ncbi:hypothetical protein FS837_006364 [Tulasnella sp. UAMH 9824]|nr:hypothetical protein FS837_006364 [Tulasnella sp. UAMH 9824]
MHRSVSASDAPVVSILPSAFCETTFKSNEVQLSATYFYKLRDFQGVLQQKQDCSYNRTPGQSGFEPCFTDDEETAFEGSDDGATVYDEDFEQTGAGFASNWNACCFPSLLAEPLDIPDDQDADLDFYPSLFDEHLDLPHDDSLELGEEDELIGCESYKFPSLFDERFDSLESDSEADLDFYPSILDEQLDLPLDDSFEWPTSKTKTVRWADSEGQALTCVVLLTEVEFQCEWDISKYPSLMDEELDIPHDELDFDWTAPIVPELQTSEVLSARRNGDRWNPSLFNEEPIYDADHDDDFQLPVTDDIPSLIDERMDLPELDWFDDFVGCKPVLREIPSERSTQEIPFPLCPL